MKNVKSGVNRFEGITSKWYGWAGVYEDSPEEDDSGSVSHLREGPLRWFRWRAQLDARRLARALRKG